jgi:pimeloyl-ACP methyl ester carboxylesterase
LDHILISSGSVIKSLEMQRLLILTLLLGFCIFSFEQQDPKPKGKLIDIGGYRLHIDIRGKGSPAVILIAGSQAFSLDWALVIPGIAAFTTVCSYDRPGLAWSDLGPMPRSFDQDVYELHTLLRKAGVPSPYVLVGHSVGGIIARFFEKKYPDEVKGMVLIDATSEDATLFINGKIQRLRLLSQNRPLPEIKTRPDSLTKLMDAKQIEEIRKMVGEPKTERPFDLLPLDIQSKRLWAMRQPKFFQSDDGTYWAEEFNKLYEDSLYTMGNKPLYLLSSGREAFNKNSDSAMRKIWMEKLEQKEKMSHLSTNSKHLITTRSRHEIHIDEPQLVIRAIHDVVVAVRKNSLLQ